MSGPLGTSGGGAAGVTSVTAGNGITVTGTTTPTIAASLAAGTGVSIAGSTTLTVTNTGVTSLAGAGVSVSAATGAVTITAPVVAGGTGISVSGSQTTSLTVTNTGVTSLAGTGISVSAATGSVTVTPTYAAPTALTIGGTVATGSAASVANSGHVHAMPGSAVAGASAVGDTASTGSATTVALSDHRHSREAFGTPIAVTGGATAASGSATTIARSDHVHSTASMGVLISTTTITALTVSVTLSSIPQTYSNLMIMVSGTTNVAGYFESVVAQYNGVTTSSYYGSALSAFATFAYLGVLNAATSNWSTTYSLCQTWIPGYANTSKKKSDWSNSWATIGAGNNSVQIPWHNIFDNTSAITSIKLFGASGGSFTANTIISLYGYP